MESEKKYLSSGNLLLQKIISMLVLYHIAKKSAVFLRYCDEHSHYDVSNSEKISMIITIILTLMCAFVFSYLNKKVWSKKEGMFFLGAIITYSVINFKELYVIFQMSLGSYDDKDEISATISLALTLLFLILIVAMAILRVTKMDLKLISVSKLNNTKSFTTEFICAVLLFWMIFVFIIYFFSNHDEIEGQYWIFHECRIYNNIMCSYLWVLTWIYICFLVWIPSMLEMEAKEMNIQEIDFMFN